MYRLQPEPRSASFEVAARTAAGQLLEEVLDQILLGELLDDLHLLDSDSNLARDRAAELDTGAAFRDEQSDELARRVKRDRKPCAPAAARKLGPELREPQRRTRVSGLRVARGPVALLRR